MFRHTVLLVIAAIAIGAAPAWAQLVKTDHDPSASFAAVMTQEGKMLTLVLEMYSARTKTLMWREMFPENFRSSVTHSG
jgi:hypothetical protein